MASIFQQWFVKSCMHCMTVLFFISMVWCKIAISLRCLSNDYTTIMGWEDITFSWWNRKRRFNIQQIRTRCGMHVVTKNINYIYGILKYKNFDWTNSIWKVKVNRKNVGNWISMDWSYVLYHTWVWNHGICMCVIVRPRSHMLIVLKKVIPDTTRYDFA